jgi:uncharacterized damage-inducible protein DinB
MSNLIDLRRWAGFVSLAAMVLLCGGLVLAEGAPPVAAGAFAKAYLPVLQHARDYSLQFAEAMPADHYGFKPVPEVMSYGEQTVHTAGTLFWFAATVAEGENPGKGFKAEGKSKAEIITYLKESFSYAEKVLSGLGDQAAAEKLTLWEGMTVTRAEAFQIVRDHTTHHRGQMVVYLRLKGITPPEYVGW